MSLNEHEFAGCGRVLSGFDRVRHLEARRPPARVRTRSSKLSSCVVRIAICQDGCQHMLRNMACGGECPETRSHRCPRSGRLWHYRKLAVSTLDLLRRPHGFVIKGSYATVDFFPFNRCSGLRKPLCRFECELMIRFFRGRRSANILPMKVDICFASDRVQPSTRESIHTLVTIALLVYSTAGTMSQYMH